MAVDERGMDPLLNGHRAFDHDFPAERGLAAEAAQPRREGQEHQVGSPDAVHRGHERHCAGTTDTATAGTPRAQAS